VSHARRHAKSAAALTISQAGTRLLSLLTLIIVQKNVSVAENGLFQLGLRVGFLLALFTEFGLRGYLVRELARHREDRIKSQEIFGNVFNVRLVLVCPVFVIGGLLCALAGYSRPALVAIGLFYFFAVGDSVAMLFKFVFRAYERMEFDAIFSVIGRTLIVSGVVVLWLMRRLTVPSIGGVHIFASLTEAALLALCITHFLGLRLVHPIHWRGMTSVLHRSIPFAVINIIGTMYMSTGTIILSKMLGEESVGYYNAASRLPEALQFFPTAVMNALIPFLARRHNDRALVERYYHFLTRYLGFLAVTCGAVLTLAPQWVITLVAKQDYLTAVPVFRCFGVWLILVYYQILAANILICLDAEKIVMARAVVALVLNVVLNMWWIRLGGVNGAAAALLATEAVSCILYLSALSRRGIPTPVSAFFRIGVVAFSAGIPIVVGLKLFPTAFWGQTLGVTGGIICAAILTVLFALKDDRPVLRSLLKGSEKPEL